MNNITNGKRLKTGFDYFAKGFSPAQLNEAFYRLTAEARQDRLLLECASFDEVDSFYNSGDTMDENDRLTTSEMIFEAVRVKAFSRTAQTMAALARAMNKQMAEKSFTVGEAVIGKPKKSGLFATVTVQLPISDGQTISIIFHSPDNNKMKIAADDEILAFRWLLNKRDITVAVSPEGEEDVSLEEVGKRVAMLVEKNATRFASTQKDILEAKKALEDVKSQVDAETAINQKALDDLKAQQDAAAQLDVDIQNAKDRLSKVNDYNDQLQAQLDALLAQQAANKGKGAGDRNADWETKPPYGEEYTGPRYKYGFQNRPYSFATAPKGSIIGTYNENDKPENLKGKARYGTIEYPFQLTTDEIYSYELLDLSGADESNESEEFAKAQDGFKDELVGRGFAMGDDDTFSLVVGTETLKVQLKQYKNIGYGVIAGTATDGKNFGNTKKLSTLSKTIIPKALVWIDKKIGALKKPAPAKVNPALSALNATEGFQEFLTQQDEGHVDGYSPVESVLNADGVAKSEGLNVQWTDSNSEYGKVAVGTFSIAEGSQAGSVQISGDGKAMFFLNGERFRGDYYLATEDFESQAAAIKELADLIKPAAVVNPETINKEHNQDGAGNGEEAVQILDDILAGKYTDSTTISDKLDEAATELEKFGLMELPEINQKLNASADYLTEILKKEAA